jgi:oligoribonuclease NrnB/cAMP/cGMP phosphodiesterase (DHH superfamily)
MKLLIDTGCRDALEAVSVDAVIYTHHHPDHISGHHLLAGRVAAVYKKAGPPPNSMIGAMLLSRFRADIAVIARPNGGVSLRSRSVNVQKIAEAMGGGGHERAAGARVEIPLHVRLLQAFYRRAVPRWVAVKVLKIAEENRICG